MSDETATAALITGIFAISLFCLKYIITCLCPGKCSGNLLVNACCKKPAQVNPLLKLTTCWEERVINKDNNKILDQSKPRGYHNNEDGYYTKRDTENSNLIVTLTKKDIEEQASVYLYFPFEKDVYYYDHFFRCKIKYTSIESFEEPEAFIRIKKFRTEKVIEKNENGIEEIKYNKYCPPKSHDVITDYPILFECCSTGTGEYNMNTFIGRVHGSGLECKVDVRREQIGIYFKSSGKYIVEEVFYSDEKINIISCPGCFYSFYKTEESTSENDNV